MRDQIRFLKSCRTAAHDRRHRAPGPPRQALASHTTRTRRQIELGPGTGSSPRRSSSAAWPSRIYAIEYSPDFGCRAVPRRERHPRRRHDPTVRCRRHGPGRSRRGSSLPLRRPAAPRPAEAHHRGPGAHGARPRSSSSPTRGTGRGHPRPLPPPRRASWIWLNLPPARVWLFRKPRWRSPHPRSAARSARDRSAKPSAAAAKELALADADVTKISLADHPPIYDGTGGEGHPGERDEAAKLIAAHQGVFIATPEYNNRAAAPQELHRLGAASVPARTASPTGTGPTASARPPTA